MTETAPSSEVAAQLSRIQGLVDRVEALGVKPRDEAPRLVAAAEFILEGLYAHRRITRSEEHRYTAAEKRREPQAPEREEFGRGRKPYN
jgi:magnesium chelatase subunit I